MKTDQGPAACVRDRVIAMVQIPGWGGHAEHRAAEGHDHGSTAVMSVEETPGQQTVFPEVTGMT